MGNRVRALVCYSKWSTDIGILPRPLRCREGCPNAQTPPSFVEFLSVTPVAITKQIARRTVQREGFQQLPGRPSLGGIRGYRKMNKTPAIVQENHKSK